MRGRGKADDRNALDQASGSQAPVAAGAGTREEATGTRPAIPAPPTIAPLVEESRTTSTERIPVQATPAPEAAPTNDPGQRIEVRHAQRAPRETPTGTLHVDVTPWAIVELKGKQIGESPLKVELPVGRHRLRIRNDRRSQPITVTIKANETTSVEWHW